MNKRLQGFIAGTLAGILLASGATVLARNTTLYDVLVGGIKIFVDGKKINPKDVSGNIVEPMIYNGTTYLPVRAVADALGKAVYWDGPNYTVYLGEMNGQLEYPTVQIEDMKSIAETPRSSKSLTDNYGNHYNRAIYNCYMSYHDYIDFEYLLNMKYSKFKGTLYIPEGETGNGSAYLTIIADGKTIYTSPEMTKTSAPVDISVNVTGYNDVEIKFSDSIGNTIQLNLADAGFYQ